MKTYQYSKQVRLIKNNNGIWLINDYDFELPPDFVYLGLAIMAGKSPVLPPYELIADDLIMGEMQCTKQTFIVTATMFGVFASNGICFKWHGTANRQHMQWLVKSDRVQEVMDVLEQWISEI